MNEPSAGVVLKPGKEKAILQKHHWIFSGAVASMPHFENGDVLSVFSSKGDFLGQGYFNRKTGIVGRMLAFDHTSAQQAVWNALDQALALRRALIDARVTTGYRLVNGEGDSLPGLVLDVYGDAVVFQSSTLGMDRLKASVLQWLKQNLCPNIIYEKSTLRGRKEEGLMPVTGYLHGTPIEQIDFTENGFAFTAQLQGQKSGFFLDQREMRSWVKELSAHKKVLNAFSYTGGFSVYALGGGASHVESVDISETAVRAIDAHLLKNRLDCNKHQGIVSDVFEFLRERPTLDYDLVILDPPAFAKKKGEVVGACRGYKEINRTALRKMPARSLLLTCSCSYYIDEGLFQQVIFQAALESGREVRVLGRHRAACDHPINVFHPESEYLKGLLLYVL